jgi:hypothetical protein
MKNRVDIEKLINDKFSKFTLREFNELVDSVLNEYDYTSKLDTANLEENPKDPGNAISIANHVNGNSISTDSSAPRSTIPPEPGYMGTETDRVIPHKIAEEGKLSTVRQRTINIPDLFSTITDPKKMTVGSADRELINNIMANIGLQQGSSWRQRIAKLQSHIDSLAKPNEQTQQNTDITQLISGLIFLNLFKKLAFFMDQPGKQFEYLFLPFLDPSASVKGSESSEIIDVTFGDKSYSLKFLKSTEPTVRGSRNNLVSNNGIADYLICRVRTGTGRLEFAEFTVSYDTGILLKGNYKPFKTTAKANSVWLVNQSGDGPRFVCLVDTKIETVRAIYAKAGLTPPEEINREKEKVEAANIAGLQVATVKDIKKISNNMTNVQASIQLAKELASKKRLDAAATEVQKINKVLSQFPSFDSQVINKNNIKDLEDFMLSVRQQALEAGQKIQTLAENLIQEAAGEFEFPIQGIWPTIRMSDVYLNFGTPEDYNKATGYVAGELNNFYVDLLDNLSQLSENITNFVATSSDTQRDSGSQTYADKSMQNADNIKSKILDIKKVK